MGVAYSGRARVSGSAYSCASMGRKVDPALAAESVTRASRGVW